MSNNLYALLNAFSHLKIMVLGEAMLDRYLKGTANRLSQEAPVQVISVEEKEDIPGGAGNTAANIRALGAEPILISVIGDDEEGRLLRQALKDHGVSDEYILADSSRQTLAKQRVLANGQMMLRFDQGTTDSIGPQCEAKLARFIRELAPQVDGIIISDYNYGVITPAVLKALAAVQQRNPRILVVDAKKYRPYQNLRVTAVKPNYAEVVKILNLDKVEGAEERIHQVEEHGPKILDIASSQIAAVTLDEDGALIFERDQPPYRIYARPAEHNRVAGAGDTFTSALALALAAGAQTNTAAEIGSAAAAIVVEKPGTSACYVEELKAYFSGDVKYIEDSFHMSARVAAYRRQGKRIVFTNGCFDILHSGHIQYLNQAKALGDVLIVGINTDQSVQRLKGPGRPINTLEDRAQVLSALSCVDHIIPFDEDIPYNLIRLIRPDVFVKGGDYTLERLPEAGLVEEMGGEIHILPYITDRSTTGIIERIQQTAGKAKKTPEKEPALKKLSKKERGVKEPAARQPSKIEAQKPAGKRSKSQESINVK